MTDIVEFLRNRLGEDEQVVEFAGPTKIGWGTYRHPDGGMAYTSPVPVAAADPSGGEWVTAGSTTVPDSVTVVYNPARLLREIEAKQMLVEHFAESLGAEPVESRDPVERSVHDEYARCAQSGALYLLKCMALPYADHPNYRQKWQI